MSGMKRTQIRNTSIKKIEKKIGNLGLEIATEKIDLDITGMTCSACAARIEKVFGRMPGIKKVSVNYAVESASIEFLPSEVSAESLIKRIEQLGFRAFSKIGEIKNLIDQREKEIRDLRRKFIISAVLSIPLVWAMAAHFQLTSFLPVPRIFLNPWFQLALATPIQFGIGMQFYHRAWNALKNKSANMDVLVVLSTSAAYLYSHYLTFSAMGSNRSMDLYYETSALIITFILLGKLLEAVTKGRTSEAINKLYRLQAKTAVIIRNGREMTIPVGDAAVGDLMLIKPGGRVPVDGRVVEGNSAIDQSVITGESIPIDKYVGDTVIGGTMNQHGVLKIKVTKIGKETALAQIIKLIEEAQGSKAPIQRLADDLMEVFVPIVVTVAGITFFAWYFFFIPGQFGAALERAIAVLIIACPCALGLATPTSILVGSGRAAESGILFKEGKHLEMLKKINVVVLDKTGTITKGKPEMTNVFVQNISEEAFLKYVGAAEKGSEHPLAAAVVKGIARKGISFPAASHFKTIPGYGIQAIIENKEILIGTRKFFSQKGIAVNSAFKTMDTLEAEGKTVMLAAVEGKFAGLVAVSDTLKETSKEAIDRLKKQGIEVIMVTGDNERTARAIARQVRIKQVYAEVLPQEKAGIIQKLQSKGNKVAMAGDGINDAPALAAADIGFVIGTGVDAAIEAGDVNLINGDLNSIANAILVSAQTMKNIKQNLFWALAYNAISIPFAMLGFLAPWLAGAVMAFSSISVVLNALRLQKVKIS